MHYEKRLTEASDPIHINFNRLWQQLDFRPHFLHEHSRAPLAEWLKNHPPGMVPDLIAAVVTQLHSSFVTQLHSSHAMDSFLRLALEYCQSILDDQGYDRSSLHQLAETADRSHQHVALVAGCQTLDVLTSRSKATYKLVKKISHVHFKIVFSGKNPASSKGTGTVQRRNEAADLEREFDRFVDDDSSFAHNRFATALENRADSTIANIRNFFTGPHLRTAHPATLYVVSSSFHVPRLARIAEDHIAKDDVLKKSVVRLVAVGAEDSVDEDPVVRTTAYVKAMMFEVFSHLLECSTDTGM